MKSLFFVLIFEMDEFYETMCTDLTWELSVANQNCWWAHHLLVFKMEDWTESSWLVCFSFVRMCYSDCSRLAYL